MNALLNVLAVLQFPVSGFQEPVARPGAPFFHAEAPVECSAMPREGGVLIALDSAGRMTAWDCTTLRRKYARPVLTAGFPPQRLTCSPDSRFVALSSRSFSASTVLVLDL